MGDVAKRLTRDEVAVLLARFAGTSPTAQRNRAAILLMYRAGLRVGEVCGLWWADVKPNGRGTQLKLRHGTKGGRQRTLTLFPDVADALAAWRARCADTASYVFTPIWRRTTGGLPSELVAMSPRYWQALLAREGAAAGIPERVHPHLLRHTFASERLEDGWSLLDVQAYLGHRYLQTTVAVYLHADQEARQAKLVLGDPAPEADETVAQLAAALGKLGRKERAALAEALLA